MQGEDVAKYSVNEHIKRDEDYEGVHRQIQGAKSHALSSCPKLTVLGTKENIKQPLIR